MFVKFHLHRYVYFQITSFKKNTCVIFSQSFVSAVFPSVNLTTFGLKILGGGCYLLADVTVCS